MSGASHPLNLGPIGLEPDQDSGCSPLRSSQERDPVGERVYCNEYQDSDQNLREKTRCYSFFLEGTKLITNSSVPGSPAFQRATSPISSAP